MLRPLLKNVMKGVLLLFAFALVACGEPEVGDDSLRETYPISEAELAKLRALVASQICDNSDVYEIEAASQTECQEKVTNQVILCESSGVVVVPQVVGSEGDNFARYAREAIRCVSEEN